MINLIAPRATDTRYFSLDGFMVGPVGPDFTSATEEHLYQSPHDRLEKGMTLYHERGVDHMRDSGSLVLDPVRHLIVYGSSSTYLEQIQVNYLPGVTITYQWGRSTDGLSGRNPTFSSLTGETRILVKTIGSSYVLYKLAFYRSDPSKIYTLSRTYFTFKSSTAMTVTYSRRREYYDVYGSPSVEDVSFAERQPLEAFLNAWGAVYNASWTRKLWTVQEGDFVSNIRIPLIGDIPSPEYIFVRSCNLLSDVYLPRGESIEGEKHYGDLAMEASEQVNATSINMIAFLRDLKRPLDMIPKLKNLKSLKGLASNFLAVKYGALPTVSDIQSIIGAFKRMKPNLDRFGNRTFSAGYSFSQLVEETPVFVTQRVKLGVAKEDNGLEALCDAIESIGMLPTFENLWDLIPYSFVLDWLVDVGGFLERVDTRSRLLRFNIRYATMSRKVIVDKTIEHKLIPYTYGNVKRVHYHRWVSDHAPVPPLSLRFALTDFDHWLESAALVVQRAK